MRDCALVGLVHLCRHREVAGGGSEKVRCMCVCVHGYASLPGGSHSEMKESFTQVEVACRKKFCVCVCFVWSCPFWGDMRVRTASCLAGFSVCVCVATSCL